MAKRDRRAEIMRAAEKLFTSRRFHEITLDEVAKQARVGKGTIYRYFENKDDLFFRTAMQGFDELCGLLKEGVSGDIPFPEQLFSACGQINEYFQSRRQLFRMMQSEDGRMHWFHGQMRKSWIEQRKNLVSVVAGIIRTGVSEGEIRSDIPAETLAGFLLGILRTRARGMTDLPESARSLELVVDLFCNGASKGRLN